MLAKLSAFLRFSLESDGKNVVPVAEECAALELYLDIERVRFVDRLSVEFDIDPAVERLAVPSFLLQPLVENSIKHAIGKSEAGGLIRITARALDKMISIAVEDSGSGDRGQDSQFTTECEAEGTGVGLSNTRERLENLYGDRGKVELVPSALGGLRINISIPGRPSRFLGPQRKASSGVSHPPAPAGWVAHPARRSTARP